MVLSIIDVLGIDWRNEKLYDNDKSTGGLSHEGETLGEFLSNTDIDQYDSASFLQSELRLCGIKEIEKINQHIEELIQQKIWDIEEELGVNIIDYRWDYR